MQRHGYDKNMHKEIIPCFNGINSIDLIVAWVFQYLNHGETGELTVETVVKVAPLCYTSIFDLFWKTKQERKKPKGVLDDKRDSIFMLNRKLLGQVHSPTKN